LTGDAGPGSRHRYQTRINLTHRRQHQLPKIWIFYAAARQTQLLVVGGALVELS